jgi:hypothetical protein
LDEPPPVGEEPKAGIQPASGDDDSGAFDAPSDSTLDSPRPDDAQWPTLVDDDGDVADVGPDVSDTGDNVPIIPPNARQLASGIVSLEGVTSDGRVIYELFQGSQIQILAQDLDADAGSATSVLNAFSTPYLLIRSSVAMVWDSCDPNCGNIGVCTCSMHLWSNATGTHDVATRSLPQIGAVSADGSYVIYVRDVNVAGNTANVVGAGAALTGETMLVATDLVNGAAPCIPQVGFAGTHAIVGICDHKKRPNVFVFDPPFGSPSLVAFQGPTPNWSADPAGRIFLQVGYYGPELWDLTANQMVSNSGSLTQLQAPAAALSGDSASAFAVASGSLYRFGIADGALDRLAGANGIVATGDHDVVFFTRAVDGGSSGYAETNLFLSSEPDAGIAAITNRVDGTFMGFSADQRYAIFRLGNDRGGYGMVYARDVQTGTVRLLASSARAPFLSAGGSRLYLFVGSGDIVSWDDLYFVDLAASNPPHLAVPHVSRALIEPKTGTIVFENSIEQPGIYALPSP